MSQWVWAIDPAIQHIALAYADMTSDTITAETLHAKTDTREGERLGRLRARVYWNARVAMQEHPPYVVFVEQPSGHIRNLQLAYATGVIQAALYEALRVPVWTIPSSKWKKTALGFGNASKEQVATWVSGRGWSFESQDECDAVAMAHAGRLMLQQSRWDASEAA